MQFSPTSEEILSLASEYNERLDAMREEAIQEQEQEEEWLEEWQKDDYEERRLERAEYLAEGYENFLID